MVGPVNGLSGFGFGAEYSDEGVLTRGGFGYTNNQPVIDGRGCLGRAMTATVLVQPYGTDFDVDTTGIEVINVTEFTTYFGYDYESFSGPRRTNYEYVLWIGVILLAIANVVILSIHFVMFVYGEKYETMLLEEEEGTE